MTHAGGSQLTDPVAVRFSSETVIGGFLAKWVQSYRDLPLLLNQWANVVRWEQNPSLFMRTNEFLWQEGHTARVTRQEARNYARRIQHEVYRDLMETVMAIPPVAGIKSRRSGASELNTFTCEAMTGDGKSLQMGTAVEGGQSFASAFDITPGGRREVAWTTSWGASTQLVGGFVMVHGDINGLRSPPMLAPTQVVIIVVDVDAVATAQALAQQLRGSGLRGVLDDRADIKAPERIATWTVKGVPYLVEVGLGDVESQAVHLVRRLSTDRSSVSFTDLASCVVGLVEEEQRGLLEAARVERDARIAPVATVRDAEEAAAVGWARLPWSMIGKGGEDTLARSGVSVRYLQQPDGAVPDSDTEPGLVAFVARSH